LKFGYKDLFFYTAKGAVIQSQKCMCLLDFYVHRTVQRQGIGKQLFDYFIDIVQIPSEFIAYDRPSPKLLPFLARHYALTNGNAQPNRYTIFPPLLEKLAAIQTSESRNSKRK
jgi:alpha-tubulin N-acetyltransferase 1